jgi:hypothetical protein
VGVSPLAKQTCSLFLLGGVSVGHGHDSGIGT